MSRRINDAGIHTAGDDPNRRARRLAREAYVAWCTSQDSNPETRASSFDPWKAFLAGWIEGQAAPWYESVDGLHSREARKEAP